MLPPMPGKADTYLGDGLYARYTGYSIILMAPRAEGTHWVEMDTSVFEQLLQFQRDLRQRTQPRMHGDDNEPPT